MSLTSESERRLRAIIATEPECVKLVGRDGALLEMNPAGLAMLEAGALAEVQAKPLLEFVAPEHRAAFVGLHRRVFGGESGILEFEAVGLKGARRWLETHAAPLRGDDGAVSALLGITRDVTERRQARERLRESEARFRSLTELSADWYWEQDEHLRFVDGGACGGAHPEEEARAFGRTRWESAGDDPSGPKWAQHRAVLDKRLPFRDFEYLRRGLDGTLRHLSISGMPIFDDAGKFRGYRGVGRDITARKQAEQRIRALNRVYAVLSGINALIVRARERGELFDEACRVAVAHGGFRMAWIGLIDEAAGKVQPLAWAGAVGDFFQAAPLAVLETAPDGHGLTGRAIRENRAMVSNDVASDPQLVMKKALAERGINSLAVMPLRIGGRPAGVMGLYAAEPGMFDREEMRLLGDLAGNVSFALETLEQKRRLERTTRVNAIRSGINAAIVRIRDRGELFREACRIAVEAGGLPFSWLCTVDEAGERLQPVATAGGGPEVLEQIGARFSLRDDAPRGHGLAAKSVRERRTFVANDVASDPAILNKDGHLRLGIRAVAALPLLVEDRAVGTFVVHAPDAGFFDDEEVKLLEEVATNIAFALDHLDKEERVRRLTRVYAVLSGINGLIVRVKDRQELFDEACRVAVAQGSFRMAWIGLVDGERVRPVAWHGTTPSYIGLMPLGTNPGPPSLYGLAGRAVNEKGAMVSNDIANDPRVHRGKQARERRVCSLAVLPLLRGGRALGVLALYASEPGFFDAEEVKLLEELAGDIAFAVEHIENAEAADYLAYYDGLTGLANRTLLLERLSQQILSAGGQSLALVIANVDRFKTVNDTLGRQAGDELLRQVAARLREAAGDPSRVARVGADQFAIVMAAVRGQDDLVRRLQRGHAHVTRRAYDVGARELRLSLRSGVALYPGDGGDADSLFRNAEAALKKARSGDPYVFYAQQMSEQIAEKLELDNRLRIAVERSQFVLHYQPKFDLATGRITGAEALIRWAHPELGLVPPGNFVPMLEETGLIVEVGAWALRHAVEDQAAWRASGLNVPRIAVNVSPVQLRRADFFQTVQAALARAAQPALELEITETLAMEDVERNVEALKALRALDVGVAIDDFGTGYSSLGYLARLPVQALKIDRSFIGGMLDNAEIMTLVTTIVSLGHSLRLRVVAEGVETEEQARVLRLLRCDEAQGYLFSKPLPADALAALLKPAG